MRNTKREIECLQKLHSSTVIYEELVQFLRAERLLSQDELLVIRGDPDKAKRLQAKLADLSRDNKLELLEYEWVLLPVERIKIVIVTENGLKEFTADG
jgi:hypothetical protein